MTPAEADERIILSRQTLSRYEDMVADGHLPVTDLVLIHDELELLAKLVRLFPVKREKIDNLALRWIGLLEAIRPTLN